MADSSGAARPATAAGSALRSSRHLACQVCSVDLADLKDYYKRYSICPEHSVMPCIVREGESRRWCQQCGKFQPLVEFEAQKRTCRRKLERHNERRRNLNSLKLSAKQAGTAVMPGLPGHSSLAPATAAGMTQRQLKRAASPEVEPEVAPDVEPEVEPPTAANAGSEGGVEEPCFSALSAAVMQGSTGGLKLEAMDLDSLPVLPDLAAAACGAGPPPSLLLQQLLPSTPEWASLLVPSPLPASLAVSTGRHQGANQPQPAGFPSIASIPDFAAASEGLGEQPRASLPVQCGQELLHQQQVLQERAAAEQDFDALMADFFPPVSPAALEACPPWLAESLLPADAAVGSLPAEHDARVRELRLQQVVAALPAPQPRTQASLQQALDMIQRQQQQGVQQQQQQQQQQEAAAGYPYSEQHPPVLSMKLFSVAPDRLPQDLSRELSQLMSLPDVEGYLRAGCIHMTLEALLPDPPAVAELRQRGVAEVVEQLLQGGSALGRLLQSGPAVVQLDGEVALVCGGSLARVLPLASCQGVIPSITSVSPIAIHTGQQLESGTSAGIRNSSSSCRVSRARVMVRGRSLLGPHQRLLVRSGGRFPLVEVLATSGPSAAAASTADTAHQEPAAAVARTKDATFGGGLQGPQEEWLEMRLPQVEQGLLSVEVQRGALLSSSRPLLALDDSGTVEELCQLEADQSGVASVEGFLRGIGLVLRYRQVKAAAERARQRPEGDGGGGGTAVGTADGDGRGSTAEGTVPADTKSALAGAAAAAARHGVVVAAGRGWPALAAMLVPSVATDKSSAEHAVRDMDAQCPPGSSLLHIATAGASAPVLQVLARWGRQQGYRWDVAAPARPSALTPLHLAAAARCSTLVKALHDMDPARAQHAWRSALTSDGLSPADFAALAKQRQQGLAPSTATAASAVTVSTLKSASGHASSIPNDKPIRAAVSSAPMTSGSKGDGEVSDGRLPVKPESPPLPTQLDVPGTAAAARNVRIEADSPNAVADGVASAVGSVGSVSPSLCMQHQSSASSLGGASTSSTPHTPPRSLARDSLASGMEPQQRYGVCASTPPPGGLSNVKLGPSTPDSLPLRRASTSPRSARVVESEAEPPATAPKDMHVTHSLSAAAVSLSASGADPVPATRVVTCVLLAFGDNPALEEEYQRQHCVNRAPYDVIRAALRLAAWLAMAVRASAHSVSLAAAAAMAGMGVAHSLAPVLLLAMHPPAFYKWRRCWVPAWNLSHMLMVCLWYYQIYLLPHPDPPGGLPNNNLNSSTAAAAAASAGTASSEPLGPLRVLSALLWLAWHSQALVMCLNAAPPLTSTLRHFIHGQLFILMLLFKHNPEHCARHGQLQAAAAAVHSRLVLPLWGHLLGHSRISGAQRGTPVGQQDAALAAERCKMYLPSMQLVLGLLLPSVLLYWLETAHRKRFLAARGMRPKPVLLRGDIGWALLAVALQLAACRTAAS
ncbi:hypothetical protein D9Q98_009242 [Chlorella vulgaris]|uniref:SBP-type domain-containing protein n=1 Tax=Chlorella vulgaris TaxID=3077 RepID=A0A9D4TP66_CHLVU|nr:hypothetical protein D9Q98_009242 [Chlorella vulgaris]